jgi:hypothetical protein
MIVAMLLASLDPAVVTALVILATVAIGREKGRHSLFAARAPATTITSLEKS